MSEQIERRYSGGTYLANEAYKADRVQAATQGWAPTGQRWEAGFLVVTYEQRTVQAPTPSIAAPWDSGSPSPAASTSSVVPPAPSQASASALSWAGIVIIIAGCLSGLGSFLPWVTATTGFVSISRNGFDGGGDGILTAAGGILVALVGIGLVAKAGAPAALKGTAAVVGLLLGFLAFTDYNTLTNNIKALSSSVSGSVGTGLIVVGFAAVLAIIGAFLPDGYPV